jgi:hypothetical protein
MNPGMTTDWVLVMVSISCNAIVDSFLVLEPKLVAKKDPEGESTARTGTFPSRSASPMVSLAKSVRNLPLSKVE